MTPATVEKPYVPSLNGVSFGVPAQPLFKSEKEAFMFFLNEVLAVLKELEAESGERWSDQKFIRETTRLWLKVGRHYF